MWFVCVCLYVCILASMCRIYTHAMLYMYKQASSQVVYSSDSSYSASGSECLQELLPLVLYTDKLTTEEMGMQLPHKLRGSTSPKLLCSCQQSRVQVLRKIYVYCCGREGVT